MLQTANELRIGLHQHEQFEAADECLREVSKAEASIDRLNLDSNGKENAGQSISGRVTRKALFQATR